MTLLQTGIVSASSFLGLTSGGEGGGVRAWFVLAIGTILSLLGLTFVQAAAARAMAEIDAGRDVSFVGAYRLALDSIRPLFLALLVAVPIVSLLTVSVFLIPIAIALAVRWALIAPCAELESLSGVGALRRSGSLVRREWFKVLSLVVATAGLVLVSGPVLGGLLLLATSASFAVVNIVSGLIYAVAMPLVGITTTYVYYDVLAREHLAEHEPPARASGRGDPGLTRSVRVGAAWTLVGAATILAFAAALNLWVERQALSTNAWTSTSARLLRDDAIRGAVSTFLVDDLSARVQVAALLEKRLLPQNLGALAGPLAAASRREEIQGTDRLLEQPRSQLLWKDANRRAHEAFLAAIDGKSLRTTATSCSISARSSSSSPAREGLAAWVPRLPPDSGQVVLVRSTQLEEARTAVRVVRTLSYVLGAAVLALYALAVFLAGPGRRRTVLLGVGASILTVGVLLLVVRRLAGDRVVVALVENPDYDTAGHHAWSIGTRLLRDAAESLIAYGAAIAIAAWIAGPSQAATRLRRGLAPAMRAHPAGIHIALTVGLLVFLVKGPTDAGRLLPVLALFAFAYLGAEVFRRQTVREFPGAG